MVDVSVSGVCSAPVAVVTGASRGIGAHLSAAFAAAGYVVEKSSRSGEGENVRVLDVSDPAAVKAYVDEVVERCGRLDVLVNNAGVIDNEVVLWEADPDQWWRTVEVDVRGPFLLARFAVPYMLMAGGGRVININSGAGTRASDISTAYYVAKTALSRITGGLHVAGFVRGLRAFDLAPGVVQTDMTAGMGVHAGRVEWTDPAAVTDLALGLASGCLDAWSGRMVRAGVDTVESLKAVADRGLTPGSRTVGLLSFGEGDPLGQ